MELEHDEQISRPEALEALCRDIINMQDALTGLWDAVMTIEAVDAAKWRDRERHAEAALNFLAVSKQWQQALFGIRNSLKMWHSAVLQRHLQESSGIALLKDMLSKKEDTPSGV